MSNIRNSRINVRSQIYMTKVTAWVSDNTWACYRHGPPVYIPKKIFKCLCSNCPSTIPNNTLMSDSEVKVKVEAPVVEALPVELPPPAMIDRVEASGIYRRAKAAKIKREEESTKEDIVYLEIPTATKETISNKRGSVELNCTLCGEKTYRRPGEVKSSKSQKFFCSIACAGFYKRKQE